MKHSKVTMLVAYDEDRVIGSGNMIPWVIPDDLKAFKKRTTGGAVIMGRKTWDSLPRKPLPQRMNIIVTRNSVVTDARSPQSEATGNYATVAPSVEIAIGAAKLAGMEDIFIIGGAQVYKYALDNKLVDSIIASEVKGQHGGDVYFPNLSTKWKKFVLEQHTEYNVVLYVKDTGD